MSTQPHLLVVDDDREIRELLARFLELHEFRVTTARDGAEARRVWPLGHFHLVVLDLMLPGETGLDLAVFFRKASKVPIIMLTAMGEETDRIVGLEMGADDYLPKPFNPRELLARIRAVLRRSGEVGPGIAGDEVRCFRFGGWQLRPSQRRLISPAGVDMALTGGEFDLLMALVERPHRVLTREMLLDLLHGRTAATYDRAIDVGISRLRRKLDSDATVAPLIKTVRGGGYVLACDVVRQ